MLEVQDLVVQYGPVAAIRGISLHVDAGEIVALIGANGAGKTTILRAISGLLQPSRGAMRFQDRDLSTLKSYEIVRKGLSHVPERRGIFANLTVFENLRMGAYTQQMLPKDLEQVYGVFPRLKEREKQIAGTLSGGEQQMLAIGRALLAKPKLLLLDEPSLGLAPQITKSILRTIQDINKAGTSVLLVEQNAQAALKIAHRGYVLEVGEIALEDWSQKLLNNDRVRRAYLGES
jgi:branched-chain amino acid transport system ATP-binding protein